MPKTVKYIGTVTRWPELATTGKQSTWVPGQQEQRSDTEAAQLLATGLFSDVDATQLPEQKVVAISGVVSGAWSVVNLRDWNGFDKSGNNDMLSIFQQAQEQLETFGAGRIELERGTYALTGNLVMRGGAPTLNGGYQGGIELVGQHVVDTVLNFSSGGIVCDVGPGPYNGSNAAQAMIWLKNLHIKGPGEGVANSVGFNCGPQGNYQSTPNAIGLERVWLDGFENLARFDDCTNLWVNWCYFLNYVKGLRFGYNQDTVSIMWNRFGDNQTVLGSQTETALAWDYMSPRFGSGNVAGTVGVAPNAAGTLAGAQNHKIAHNWFMRQLLVSDIADPSTTNVTHEHNQYESCRHYAQIGNTTSTSAPGRLIYRQNTFMRTDHQDETQAKFLWMNSAAAGSLELDNNVSDAATGPKYGWVRCGTGSVVKFKNNSLPISGGYVVDAFHLMVGTSGKNVALSTGAEYTFAGPGSTGNTDERQANFSGRDNVPDRAHWGYNSSASASIYQRWAAKSVSSDAVSGNSYDIKSLTINGTRYATALGFVQPLSGASTPSLGSDGPVARSGFYFVQGGAGVADTLYCCMKSAADTYSWKLVATG